MPDSRRHRGPHPQDARLFAEDQLPPLRAAAYDLNWLLSRGYAGPSAMKLVGDRHALVKRQRIAVMRCCCSDAALASRKARQIDVHELGGRRLLIDGYNLLTTVEAALAGGVILVGRDGCYRDMASVHGTYRKVEETLPALERIGRVLHDAGVAECRWYLDSPVSNSGRLKAAMLETAAKRGWPWQVELVTDPDRVLVESSEIITTADSAVLDGCDKWTSLASEVVRRCACDTNWIDLSVNGRRDAGRM